MKLIIIDFTDFLSSKNIQPTIQRIKVLEYVSHNNTHSIADQINLSLLDQNPTLSKMTLYNMLNYFVEQQIINVFKLHLGNHIMIYCLTLTDIFIV